MGRVAPRLLVAAVAVALIVGIAVLVVGEGSSEGGDEVTGVGEVRAGSVASLAQCSDWNEGSDEEKLATIADIRAQLSQSGSDGPTPQLSDDAAYELLERTCANDYAAGFRLYKIYARGAAFAPLTE